MTHVPPRADEPIVDDAVRWHLRLRDADEATWDAFVLWLEESPLHNMAYEEVVSADDSAAALVSDAPRQLQVANDDEPRHGHAAEPRRGRLPVMAALALVASLLLAFITLPLLQGGGSFYTVETRGGEQRVVRLDDRTRIALNGGTRITLDRSDSRFARLERGEATFDVVHDAGQPFRVDLGDATLVDIGTRFNVVRETSDFSVAVAEGAVRFRSGGSSADVLAGQSLERRANGMLVRKTVNPAHVGSWREGRLTYRDAPLTQVASDLSRSLGADVRIAGRPRVSPQRFTGVIQVTRDEQEMKRQLDALLGVRASRNQAGWILTPDDRARR